MKENKKVVIVGNSVSVRIRPAQEDGKSYAQIIEDQGVETVNLAYSGRMITDFSRNPDIILRHNPDVVIFNSGIVELSSRSTSRRLYDWMFYKAKTRTYWIFVENVLKAFEAKLRKPLVNLRGKRSWISSKAFVNEYKTLIEALTKNQNIQIVCIPVNIPGKRIEDKLPGTTKRVKQVNMELLSTVQPLNCLWVTLDESEVETPDGIHFSSNDHILLSEKIMAIISR